MPTSCACMWINPCYCQPAHLSGPSANMLYGHMPHNASGIIVPYYVHNLQPIIVTNVNKMFHLLAITQQLKTVAETKMNRLSSRSHTLYRSSTAPAHGISVDNVQGSDVAVKCCTRGILSIETTSATYSAELAAM